MGLLRRSLIKIYILTCTLARQDSALRMQFLFGVHRQCGGKSTAHCAVISFF